MANKYVPIQIDIGSNRKAVAQIREDVADYFGFKSTQSGEQTVTRRRKAHKRAVYGGLDDKTVTTTNVEASTWVALPSATKSGSGIAVRVPTKLKTEKGNIREVTIRFPQSAIVSAISNFLSSGDTTKRPDYFIMPSGRKYPVVKITKDVNPGEQEQSTNPVEAQP